MFMGLYLFAFSLVFFGILLTLGDPKRPTSWNIICLYLLLVLLFGPLAYADHLCAKHQKNAG